MTHFDLTFTSTAEARLYSDQSERVDVYLKAEGVEVTAQWGGTAAAWAAADPEHPSDNGWQVKTSKEEADRLAQGISDLVGRPVTVEEWKP